MKNIFITAALLSVAHGFAQPPDKIKQGPPTHYVNPFIGTGGHGHTFPGATVPFGMVQLSPDTRIDGSWDGCGGYHYSDSLIYGFSHTHLSGTGVSDYGDVLLMPAAERPDPGKEKYRCAFTHDHEKAEAGYYAVTLRDGVKAELTATARTGFHKYTFPGKKEGYIILDLEHRDELVDADYQVIGKNRIEGFRRSKAWARDQYVFFSIEFSEPFDCAYWDPNQNTYVQGDDLSGQRRRCLLKFNVRKHKTIFVKAGISQTGIEGARKNREAEINHWDFEKTRNAATTLWNEELSKIKVSGFKKDDLAVFYTALYHCMIHPSLASDVDGRYRGRDMQVHQADHDYYTVFSLWDTFRALHPLLAVIDKKRTTAFIKTFLLQYQQGGRLPVWELSSNETDCMIGYHSASVITDAYVRGVRDFDTELALEAMIKSANWNHLGLPAYSKKGYLEPEDEHESVSKTLEYAYDDWCIGEFARMLGKNEVAEKYFERSLSWRNLFNPQSKFIQPRTNGGWLLPFDPREVNNHYTEANGWQYTFFVPHDMNNLVLAMGGEKKFGQKLDSLFYGSNATTGREQPDVTGLIGQYAHGNEPSHHMTYLYNWTDKPWKAQELNQKIRSTFYKNTPDGLIGNEDCGQMSAWYVFSALGFYPVCPGRTEYVLGTPAFAQSEIKLENGKSIIIRAPQVSEKNRYVDHVSHFYFTHAEIENGITLDFEMSNKPQTEYPFFEGLRMPKFSVETGTFINTPVIQATKRTFKDSMQVTISRSGYRFVRIDYRVTCTNANDSVITGAWKEYEKPFYVTSDCKVEAVAYGPEKEGRGISSVAVANYHRIPHNWTLEIKGRYNPQYTAGGDEGLIDGLRGDENWRKGFWQGYQSQDFECIIDLKEEKELYQVGAGFLQDTRAWILFPTVVEFYVSKDGKTFDKIGEQTSDVAADNYDVQVKDFSYSWKSSLKFRYVKVVAKNFGKLPDWHPGYPYRGDAFIFVDEVWVK